MIKKIIKWVLLSAAVLIFVSTVDFLVWRSQQIKYLDSNSFLIQTSQGIVEYSMNGSGPAVLVLHGTLGGYDQVQILAKMLDGSNKKFIFVSRPGYLRTPLSTGQTFEEQADAYASLLDELGINQVAVIATSGGGLSALQFALRYPDRCWGMVLIAANSDVMAGDGNKIKNSSSIQPPAWLTDILLSDLTSWIITRLSQLMPERVLAATVGEDNVQAVMNDPSKQKTFTEFINTVALLSLRRSGSLNDGRQFLTYTNNPLEEITCPALILYGTKDTFVPYAQQDYLADTLPYNEYQEIEGGTHFMLISHTQVLAPLINDFLNRNAPEK